MTKHLVSARRFKIETIQNPVALMVSEDIETQRHTEVMQAINALKGAMAPAEELTASFTADYSHQIAEAKKLKAELDEIQQAINDTKKEIATLHRNSMREDEMVRVTDELGAIVTDTEQATEAILNSAEKIDEDANDLIAALKKDANVDLARDVQDQTIKIFEACNFQDLTGQRITKVVNAMRFIETRVEKMMEIWGGMEVFEEIEAEMIPQAEGDAALLNGPALHHDTERASQDDIDALFD